jgi:enterochelin esterase family protein
MRLPSFFLTTLTSAAFFGCSSQSGSPPETATAGSSGGPAAGGEAGASAGAPFTSAGAGGAPSAVAGAGGAAVGGAAAGGPTGGSSASAGMAGAGGSAGGVTVVDPGPEGDGAVEIGPSYPSGPVADLTDRGSPRGRSFRFELSSEESEFYRGDDPTLNDERSFMRRIDVYVPATFKADKPAPLLVIHDGPAQLGLVSRALDNLTISTDPKRRLPAFVAIAVANGGGDGKGSQRGLEYDTMSDRFARFIHEEVLPAVEGRADIKEAYPGFQLTKDPEGRATMGCSSGGAAALTMGWFRPDLFRRLITYSGTFVDQQDDDAAEEELFPLGAWEYHSSMKLIEKAEKKPLRIFLHHSDADNGAGQAESGHHNWVMANQRTAAVLAAKGYHYRHLTAVNAGHCSGKVFDATLADTLVWAWRGYPVE